MGLTIYMVEVKEDEKRIYIKLIKNENVERVYNNNYFFSLGIDVVQDKKKSGKKDEEPVLDKAVDDDASSMSKRISSVAENIVEGISNIELGPKLEFIIEKSGSEPGIKTLDSYLETVKTTTNMNPLSTFPGSNVDYILLENLTNDLHSCCKYIKAEGMQLMKKMKEDVYIVNGRFLFLTEEIVAFDEKNITDEENLLKLLSEVAGINYVKGEDHFKGFIYGTFLYNKLKHLISE